MNFSFRVILSLSKGVARNARCLSSSKASWHARLDELGETRVRFDKLRVTTKVEFYDDNAVRASVRSSVPS